ncbi:MAG: YfjI family protein, partial [Alphaproteobacteria bacterium]|nr:YfjI family protein [Alphaproteobacteria bacterium]
AAGWTRPEPPSRPEYEGPRPLRRALPPATPFPIAAFDCAQVLRDAILAIAARTQAPLAICGNAVLAAATVCAQAHADVKMPYNEPRPLSDDFVSVAESGDRKTSADDLALRPIREREAELRKDYAFAMQAYREELDAYKAHKEHLQHSLKKDRQALREAMAKLGPEPSKPLKPTILIDNPTVEGMETYAAEGQPSFGLFTAEGGKLLGGHLLNDENRMKAGATLNLLWDGKPMPRFRRDYGEKLPGRRFSMHVMVQPVIATRMLSDETLLNLGTLARCLVVAPDSTAGTRFWRDVPAAAGMALRDYGNALAVLLERDPPKGNEPNELKPPALPLSTDADRLWKAYHDKVERKLARDGIWATIRALGAKLPEHAARIAGTLTIATDPDATEIGTHALEGGMILADYYAAEALRLVAAGLTDPDLILAEKLLAWLHADPARTVVHLREIYQYGPNAIRDKATALRIVAILMDHDWLRRLKDWTEIDGQRRRDAWQVMR